MSDSPTVHVVAHWDEDSEQYWFTECTPGDHDDDSNSYEGDVPADIWQRRNTLWDDLRGIDNRLADHLNLDAADGRRREACPRWNGDEYPGMRPMWWIEITRSEVDEWPAQDARVGFYHDSLDAAEQYLALLPDEFWLACPGPQPVLVTKDRLSIKHHRGSGPTSYSCHDCGWERSEHSA